MDCFKELDFPNLDHGLNSSNPQQTTETNNKVMEISPSEGFFELDMPYQRKQLTNEFDDLENFSHHFNNHFPLPDENFGDEVVVPHCNEGNASGVGTCVKEEEEEENQEMMPSAFSSSRSTKNKSVRVLEFDEIKKHFDLKIEEAAKEMDVGLTFLKRRCRELKIMRWPHRKLKSLNSLIDNVKEMGLGGEVAKLENHRMMLESIPGMDLSDKTKKLRQAACFKAKCKRKKRCLAIQA